MKSTYCDYSSFCSAWQAEILLFFCLCFLILCWKLLANACLEINRNDQIIKVYGKTPENIFYFEHGFLLNPLPLLYNLKVTSKRREFYEYRWSALRLLPCGRSDNKWERFGTWISRGVRSRIGGTSKGHTKRRDEGLDFSRWSKWQQGGNFSGQDCLRLSCHIEFAIGGWDILKIHHSDTSGF